MVLTPLHEKLRPQRGGQLLNHVIEEWYFNKFLMLLVGLIGVAITLKINT